jgi:multidrug resistance efflux pump
MDSAGLMLDRLEMATHLLGGYAPVLDEGTLDSRDRAIAALAAQPALRLSREQFERLRALFQEGAVLVERARAARATVLAQIQATAAALQFASALEPGGSEQAVMDVRL